MTCGGTSSSSSVDETERSRMLGGPLTSSQIQQYAREGYVVTESFVLPEQLEPLRAATARATQRARAGAWPHGIRTAASPFPPYNQDASNDVWGVNLLIHPDMGEDAFLSWYGSDIVLDSCAQLLQVARADLQLGQCNLLVNPLYTEFGLAWHRDMVPATTTAAEEAAALAEGAREQTGVQWNTALFEDACFVFVPSTHARVRTALEREATTRKEASMAPLPGQVVLTLQPGQTVVYNPNLLHRADYSPAAVRATLHCSVCRGAEHGGELRAAGMAHVLGRDKLGWIHSEAFARSLAPHAGVRSMHAELLRSLQKAEADGLFASEDQREHERVVAYQAVVT